MNVNTTTSVNKNNNNKIAVSKAKTAGNSNTIPMNNNNATTSNSTLPAAADIASAAAAAVATTAAAVLTPTITVIDAAVVTSNAANNTNTPSLPAPAKNAPTNALTNGESANDGDAQNMRLILPVFIQNERKYSQPERQRKIQSSPVKSMRRFSQDSSEILEKQLNVSRPAKEYNRE